MSSPTYSPSLKSFLPEETEKIEDMKITRMLEQEEEKKDILSIQYINHRNLLKDTMDEILFFNVCK